MSKTYKSPKLWFDEEDFDVVNDRHDAPKKLSKAELKKQREAEVLEMMLKNGLG